MGELKTPGTFPTDIWKPQVHVLARNACSSRVIQSLSTMQTASSFDVVSVAVSPIAALDAVQHGEDTRLPHTSSPHTNETLPEAAVWFVRVKDRMNVWMIAGEQQRAAEQLATLTASAAVREDAEPATKKTKRDEAKTKKALCFNCDLFLGRKFDDPSLQFKDWLKEDQEKHHDIDRQWYVQMRFGAPMVSTERIPLASVIRHVRPRPLPLPRQTLQLEAQPEAYGSSWD